jgi:hypothetical protein
MPATTRCLFESVSRGCLCGRDVWISAWGASAAWMGGGIVMRLAIGGSEVTGTDKSQSCRPSLPALLEVCENA